MFALLIYAFAIFTGTNSECSIANFTDPQFSAGIKNDSAGQGESHAYSDYHVTPTLSATNVARTVPHNFYGKEVEDADKTPAAPAAARARMRRIRGALVALQRLQVSTVSG